MKLSCTLSAIALIGLVGCGGEREAEEPVVAEEGLGDREGIAPVGEGELAREEGELGQEGVIGEAGEREGVIAAEGAEREAAIGAESVEREE